MTQKYLYLINFNEPFPSSEYGGLIAAIASDDAECHFILQKENLWSEKYAHLIMPAVVNAQKFALANEYESDVLEAFTT